MLDTSAKLWKSTVKLHHWTISVHPSALPHETPPLPLKRFSCNLRFSSIFSKICRENTTPSFRLSSVRLIDMEVTWLIIRKWPQFKLVARDRRHFCMPLVARDICIEGLGRSSNNRRTVWTGAGAYDTFPALTYCFAPCRFAINSQYCVCEYTQRMSTHHNRDTIFIQSDKNNRYFTWKTIYIFNHIWLNSS